MNTVFGRCKILKPLPKWDNSLHEDQKQIDRQTWSMTYPFSFCVDPSSESGRFSSTTDLPYYDTTLEACSCYDFQMRKLPCKHIYRLAVELGYIKIINRTDKQYRKEKIQTILSSEDIDDTPEQQKRISNARKIKPENIVIDFEMCTAKIYGSGKEPYNVSLDSCTCQDFTTRGGLPCKHIYRLRFEINEKNKYGLTEENDLGDQSNDTNESICINDVVVDHDLSNHSNLLDGKIFVLIGTFNSFSREDAFCIIEQYGGILSGSVSKKTYCVIAGNDAKESKLERARALGIPVMTEAEFMEMTRRLASGFTGTLT